MTKKPNETLDELFPDGGVRNAEEATLDEDEELDAASRGENLTEEDAPIGTGEIDAMGRAAGIPPNSERPFTGIAAVDWRDKSRWELDPESDGRGPAHAAAK
ncbi:MAG: hypothetical protein IPL79_12220 [Myxococcales bacterium]|nr:hypothetical protein [Myxococcales bacterium]